MGIKSGVGDKVAPWIEWICSQVVWGKEKKREGKKLFVFNFRGGKRR